jgi:LPPG:FO 2-phospho-L-lactate transferase
VRLTLVGGGIGCSRLAVPLARVLAGDLLQLVVNTADDCWRYGLRICPDLDTNLYALAGWQDRTRGWGLGGDTFVAMDQVRLLGEDAWFGLGDRDLATHLVRTEWLREGRPLSSVTAELTRRVGLADGLRLLPMTDDEVATVVTTAVGDLGFQEWFVRHRATDVVDVRRVGPPSPRPGPGVLEALADADVVVLAPSSPVASIEPVLELAGVRETLADAAVVAVTPVVHALPPVDQGDAHHARARAALLAARGIEHRPRAVAGLYAGLADVFVLDDADAAEAAAIEAHGMQVCLGPTLIRSERDGHRLADTVMGAVDLARARRGAGAAD